MGRSADGSWGEPSCAWLAASLSSTHYGLRVTSDLTSSCPSCSSTFSNQLTTQLVRFCRRRWCCQLTFGIYYFRKIKNWELHLLGMPSRKWKYNNIIAAEHSAWAAIYVTAKPHESTKSRAPIDFLRGKVVRSIYKILRNPSISSLRSCLVPTP